MPGWTCRYKDASPSGHSIRACYRECSTDSHCSPIANDLLCYLNGGVCVGKSTQSGTAKDYETCLNNADCAAGYVCIDVRYSETSDTRCLRDCSSSASTCPSDYSCRTSRGETQNTTPRACFRNCTSDTTCMNINNRLYCSTARGVCLIRTY
jgi:hypothetical protein